MKFRPVPGYEKYEVSSDGELRNSATKIRLTEKTNRTGYHAYSVRIEGRNRTLLTHRAVALAWIGEPPDGRPCVAHLDGDRSNNHVSNLAWVSYRENEKHKRIHGTVQFGDCHPRHKLTADIVRQARIDYIAGRMTMRHMSRIHDVSDTTMMAALHGKTWKHVDFPDVQRNLAQEVKHETD